MTERYIPAALRRLVTERAAGYCEYCRCSAKYAAQSFAIEHIVPRQAEGPTVADNLALACQDFTEIIGLTPTGRATVIALKLNREGLVHLRRVLFTVEEHPPLEQ